MSEEWRPIAGFEGWYSVSDLGRVRSEDRVISVKAHRGGTQQFHKGKVLTAGPGWSGRPTITLHSPGRRITRSVHQLVLEAFMGPRPPGKEALHWDDDRTNNQLSNLRWGTRSENLHDLIRNGRHNYAKRTECEYGHEFSAENTIIRPEGSRRCRECKRIRAIEYWHRRGKQNRRNRQKAATA